MKITMTIEADSAPELQNTMLQLADFCSLAKQGGKAAQPLAPYVAEEQTASTPVPPSEIVFTKEQVRDKMGALPTAKVRELLQEFGVKRLSDIPPSSYPSLMEKAQ